MIYAPDHGSNTPVEVLTVGHARHLRASEQSYRSGRPHIYQHKGHWWYWYQTKKGKELYDQEAARFCLKQTVVSIS